MNHYYFSTGLLKSTHRYHPSYPIKYPSFHLIQIIGKVIHYFSLPNTTNYNVTSHIIFSQRMLHQPIFEPCKGVHCVAPRTEGRSSGMRGMKCRGFTWRRGLPFTSAPLSLALRTTWASFLEVGGLVLT